MTRERDLYLDLLSKILVNSIYRDGSIHPDNKGGYDADARGVGADWPAQAHTMVGEKRLANLRTLVERALNDGIPGDFIETGVWRGGCCILMRGILEAYGISDRKVWVADSFEGLPDPNPVDFPADEGLFLSQFRELAISLEQVQENFRRYGLLDDQVAFVKGWFSDTLPGLDAGPFALLRLDGDLYESTIVALESLYPKLSVGGYVIIDDYHVIPQCRDAVAHYRDRYGITDPIHDVDWAGTWWQKTSALPG